MTTSDPWPALPVLMIWLILRAKVDVRRGLAQAGEWGKRGGGQGVVVSEAGAADATDSEREPTGAAVLVRRFAAVLSDERDRWFLWAPVLFGAGIFCYFRLPGEPHLLAALMPVLGVLGLMALRRRR